MTDHINRCSHDRAPGSGRQRIHGLDAVRASALLLGIVLHGLVPFAEGFPWMVEDSKRDHWPLIVIGVIHTFRMILFLLMAGYFGSLMRDRYGTRRYLIDRIKRIGLPAFAFWPVAVLPLGLLAIWHLLRIGQPVPAPGEIEQSGPSLGHLWFLWVLMQCIVIALVVRALVVRVAPQAVAMWSARMTRWLTLPGGVVLASVPYAVTTVIQGDMSGIVPPPTLLADPITLPAHLGAFVIGWLLTSDPEALPRLGRQAWLHTVAAVLAQIAVLAATDMIPLGISTPRPVCSVLIAVAGWTSCYALLGLAVRYLVTERPWIRYLADASYWMYLMHLVMQTFGAVLLARLDWPLMVKLSLNLTASTAALILSYRWLVRFSWLGGWINGRRYSKPKKNTETRADPGPVNNYPA